MKSAKEYWKERFDEYPQNDAERLAVVMMMEYYHDITKEDAVNKISSKQVVSRRLPTTEDVKRWYQLLVGINEEAMQKDMEATFG